MVKHLPNFLTCCNLICGCLGIIFLWEDNSIPTAYFVWAAVGFDFLDGFTARMLRFSSPIGKELDSLADVVSFGALPAFFMYDRLALESPFSSLPYIAILIAVCSAIRLAVFNTDKSQDDSFKGLPTPANAIFLTALPFLDYPVFDWVFSPVILSVIVVVFSLLMVSRIDLFALKFKNFSWEENKIRFTFLVLSVLLLAVLKFAALPLIIILYIILSLGVRVISK